MSHIIIVILENCWYLHQAQHNRLVEVMPAPRARGHEDLHEADDGVHGVDIKVPPSEAVFRRVVEDDPVEQGDE